MMSTGRAVRGIRATVDSWLNGIVIGLIVVFLGLGVALNFGEGAAVIFLSASVILALGSLYVLWSKERAFRTHCHEVGIRSPVWPKGFWMAIAALMTVAAMSGVSLALGFYMVSKMRLPW
ncbi:hypothetical protein C4571_02830 [Candidatus Parcubacteria bacterium]|nr:MAG: hypothetical protein C4571_02830 [Candidatus Parcubacteria bacterium]